MQRHVVKTFNDLEAIVSKHSDSPEFLSIPSVGDGVWLSDSLWQTYQTKEKEAVAASSSLEKAVSLLIQETKKSDLSQQAVNLKEQQFIRVFSMSLTPMRIEDWTRVKQQLAELGKRYNPIEIKEKLQSSPEDLREMLGMVKVLDCNKAFREAVDAEHNPEYLGALDKIIPESEHQAIVSLLLQVAENKPEIREHIKIKRFDGGVRDVRLHMSLYSDDDASETKMLVSYRDVTQQNRITKHLHGQDKPNDEDRHRSLVALNSIREGVITTDQSGNIINLNPTAQKVTGWAKDYFQRPIREIFSPVCDQFKSIDDIIEASYKHTRPVECEVISQFTNVAGDCFWLTYSVTPIISDAVISGFIVIFHDVSESKQLLDQIKQHKNQDPITKLLNRQAFKSQLNSTIKKAKLQRSDHALLLVDIDRFHVFNDTCGHTGGDLLLKQVADTLKGLVRSDDVLARIGGDEFGILLNGCDGSVALRIAHKLLKGVEAVKFEYDSKVFKVNASVGMVVIDDQASSVDKVLTDVGSVVEVAKESGSSQVQVYDAKQKTLKEKQDQLRWFTKITHALDNDRLVLSYQKIAPTAKVDDGADTHYEILIRMLDDDGKLISPGEFLPAAERYNLMPKIDRWVVKNAFRWIGINLHRSQSISLFSINLSGLSIGDENFASYVEAAFKRFHVPGNRVCFEITESMAINNLDNTLNFMERFRAIGCKFSLDDFGTGFSSYGYLKTLPVDFLKIDGSFVRRITSDPIDLAMVKSINEVGHVMDRKTIAEYVEDEETMELLRQIGVDYAQGYGVETPQLLEPEKEKNRSAG